MADIQRREKRVVSTGTARNGSIVQEETTAVDASVDKKTTAINVIWYIYGFISILLGIRMIMKLFGANYENEFVQLVYTVSGVVSAPFDTIFNVRTSAAGTGRVIFEPSILVAIAVYGLIAWGIAKLLTLNER